MAASAGGAGSTAKEALRLPSRRKWDSKGKDSRMRAFFGASSAVIAAIWNLIVAKAGGTGSLESASLEHLLRALLLLKVYAAEEAHCSIAGWPATKAFRKWPWHFAGKIAELKDGLAKLGSRLNGLPEVARASCFMPVGGEIGRAHV